MTDYTKKKYLTIGEVSNITEVPPHTLRYWEDEFNLLRPLKRESGQRRYTSADLKTVEKIKKLLYEEKYSIAGAKKHLLKEKSQSAQTEMPFFKSTIDSVVLKEIKKDLLDIKELLEREI